MLIEVVNPKIHKVSITGAKLHYVGSITIDEDLPDVKSLKPIIIFPDTKTNKLI